MSDQITKLPESVSPAGLRVRASIQRDRSDESCARHLELAADEIERLLALMKAKRRQ